MPHYRVKLAGENFRLTLDGKPMKLGFLTTRLVEAQDEARAELDEFLAAGGAAGLTAPEDRIKPYAYPSISAQEYLRAMRIRRHIAAAMDELCAGFDAIVSPTLPAVATPLDQPFTTGLSRRGPPLTAAANLAGLPAISVPNSSTFNPTSGPLTTMPKNTA